MKTATNGITNIATINAIKARMFAGELTYEEALAEATPIVDAMNDKGKEIAKKYGRRYTPLTVGYVFRQ